MRVIFDLVEAIFLLSLIEVVESPLERSLVSQLSSDRVPSRTKRSNFAEGGLMLCCWSVCSRIGDVHLVCVKVLFRMPVVCVVWCLVGAVGW